MDRPIDFEIFDWLCDRILHGPDSLATLVCPSGEQTRIDYDGFAMVRGAGVLGLDQWFAPWRKCMGDMGAGDSWALPFSLLLLFPDHMPKYSVYETNLINICFQCFEN